MGANKRNEKKYHSKTNKYNLTKPVRKPIQTTAFSPSDGKYASDIAQLRPALREEGFYIKEIIPDGNCLFRAFSFFRERGNQENHMKYRKEVIHYLRLNKEDYQPIFENREELEDYITMMSKDRAWGGELEMSILSKLYKCGFLIHANNRPNISVSSLCGLK